MKLLALILLRQRSHPPPPPPSAPGLAAAAPPPACWRRPTLAIPYSTSSSSSSSASASSSTPSTSSDSDVDTHKALKPVGDASRSGPHDSGGCDPASAAGNGAGAAGVVIDAHGEAVEEDAGAGAGARVSPLPAEMMADMDSRVLNQRMGQVVRAVAAAEFILAEERAMRGPGGGDLDDAGEDDAGGSGRGEERRRRQREVAERRFLLQNRQRERDGGGEGGDARKPLPNRTLLGDGSKLRETPATRRSGLMRAAGAKEDAQTYKTPTQQLWDDYWTIRPTVENFESIVEQQIAQARREGAFDNLRGRGKPLPPGPSDANPLQSETEYLLNRMVAAQGHVPGWVETGREVDEETRALRKELRAIWDECFAPEPVGGIEPGAGGAHGGGGASGSGTVGAGGLAGREKVGIVGMLSALFSAPDRPSPTPAVQRAAPPSSSSSGWKSPEAGWEERGKEWATLRIAEINKKVRSFNLSAPSGIPQKIPLIVERELERADPRKSS
ncbi:hypothetical protein DFJ73DRAFT_581405 [Zopfochytrium polystomum]|nr:hypothetical protein DFJ73DRAFT_581405 [Zopfochytrium polystomum]